MYLVLTQVLNPCRFSLAIAMSCVRRCGSSFNRMRVSKRFHATVAVYLAAPNLRYYVPYYLVCRYLIGKIPIT